MFEKNSGKTGQDLSFKRNVSQLDQQRSTVKRKKLQQNQQQIVINQSAQSTISNLQQQSTKPIEFICPFENCNVKFFKNSSARNRNKCVEFHEHVKSHHNHQKDDLSIIRCKAKMGENQCKRSFSKKKKIGHFIEHLDTCLMVFECSICKKSFTLKLRRDLHEKTHQFEDEKAQCSICKKTIKTTWKDGKILHANDRLIDHQKIHQSCYVYNWQVLIGHEKKHVYTGRSSWNSQNSSLRFLVTLVKMMILYKKRIKCLETRIIEKIIQNNWSLIVTFVLNNVSSDQSDDCEAKLIAYYKMNQSDGENFTLNRQLQHKQINYKIDNINQYLQTIESNISERNYIKFDKNHFDRLFQIFCESKTSFKQDYDQLDISNYKISVRGEETCFTRKIQYILRLSKSLRSSINDFLNKIIKRENTNLSFHLV